VGPTAENDDENTVRSVPLVLAVALAVASFPRVALADKLTEAAAKTALKKAEGDFLAQSYGKGSAVLAKALKACGTTKCTPATRAALLRDLGAMAFRQGDSAGATKDFADAVAIQPDLDLNPRYDAPDLRNAFAQAKGGGDSGGHEQPSGGPAPTAPAEQKADTAPPAHVDGSGNGSAERENGSKPKRPFKRFWIGLGATVDFQVIPKGTNLCRLNPEPPGTIVLDAAKPENDGNIYCTNQDGSDFPERANQAQNNLLQPGSAGNSNGGVRHGEARLMLSFDYALSANFLVGARLGVSLLTYPGVAAYTDGRAWSFAGSHFYVDARATYLFGEDAVEKTFAPMLFGGIGLASFATSTSSGITFTNGETTTVNLWQTNGPFFVLVGGGVHIMVNESFGGAVGVRVNGSFGANGLVPTLGPEVGVQYGF
jgi:hypothetical protein